MEEIRYVNISTSTEMIFFDQKEKFWAFDRSDFDKEKLNYNFILEKGPISEKSYETLKKNPAALEHMKLLGYAHWNLSSQHFIEITWQNLVAIYPELESKPVCDQAARDMDELGLLIEEEAAKNKTTPHLDACNMFLMEFSFFFDEHESLSKFYELDFNNRIKIIFKKETDTKKALDLAWREGKDLIKLAEVKKEIFNEHFVNKVFMTKAPEEPTCWKNNTENLVTLKHEKNYIDGRANSILINQQEK